MDDRSPTPRLISRRDLLAGAAFGVSALTLTSCAAPAAPSRSGATPSPTTSPTGVPSPTTAPTPAATPGPPLREAIAGLIVIGFRGAKLGEAPWLRAALDEERLGGVILFDRDQETRGLRNVVSPDQLTTLVRDLRDAAGDRPLMVAIDQEGGRVTRLSPAHGFPSVPSQAEIGRGTVADARSWGEGVAGTLSGVGINLNFAPVVDLNVNPTNPAIGALDRSFSADPDVVVEMATAEIEAHRAAGVLTTLKHFPGIGRATTNTDFGVADVTDTWTRTELEPFRRLIAAGSADLVMAGHVVNRTLDPDLPASLSRAVVTDLLRGELDWEGVVVTDDLQAAAIDEAFGFDEAVTLALDAGNDLLLLGNQARYDEELADRAIEVIVSAVDAGRVSEERIREAWGRVQRAFSAQSGVIGTSGRVTSSGGMTPIS